MTGIVSSTQPDAEMDDYILTIEGTAIIICQQDPQGDIGELVTIAEFKAKQVIKLLHEEDLL